MEYHTLERVIYILRPHTPPPAQKKKNKTRRKMSLSFHPPLVPPAFFHLKGWEFYIYRNITIYHKFLEHVVLVLLVLQRPCPPTVDML